MKLHPVMAIRWQFAISRREAPIFHDADIAATFGLGGLNGVGGDGDFVDACSVDGGIDPNFRGWFRGEFGQ